MAYTLEQLSKDVHAALAANPGRNGKLAVCELVTKALRDKAFIDTHLTVENCKPRRVLYEDSELGFCICGHVYPKGGNAQPHDHGTSWAIYGVAEGDTEMTDWKVVKQGANGQPTLVEPDKSYLMKPGDAHFYDVGDIHSPARAGLTKLIRIEGANLDHVQRSNIRAA